MRDFDLDEEFWPDALAALASPAPAERLRIAWPAYGELIEELVADAAREPLLVGVRIATHGRNPRLLAVLTASFLARSGIPTLLLDLSPDTRWLEQLLGGDFKEGLIDHLRFDVPLERCLRPTGFEGLSAMSGGAWFLAGSPLDDAPGFRGALERLRQRQAVVVTLPPPLEAGDRTGIASLCDALVTVEEGSGDAPLAGSERAVVRLIGDPEAARDLAQLAHRFLGPLPAVLAGMARASREEAAPRTGDATDTGAGADMGAGADTGAEDLDFLRRFEEASGAAVADDLGFGPEPTPPEPEVGRRGPGRTVAASALALVAIAAVVMSARGIASDMVGWLFDPGAKEHGYDMAVGGEAISLEPPPLALPVPLPADSEAIAAFETTAVGTADSVPLAGAESPPADTVAGTVPRGQPAPYSVHVGSYQSAESGMRVVDRMQQMGYVATLAPVSLAGKGTWYRVYVGAFADSSSARRVRERLQSTAVVEEALVRPTPWTFEIGVYPSPEAARPDIEKLRRQGIAAYMIGGEPLRLYAGAYQTREDAELLARALDSALGGRTATLTLREE